MSDWYARQFGDSAEFAIAISFGQPSHGENDPAWGGIALWVKGRCLTRSVDSSDAVSQPVRWHLFELLRWLRSSAVRLINEEPFPSLAASVSAHEDLRARDACDWLDQTAEPPSTLSDAEEDHWFLTRSDWRRHHSLRCSIDGVALPNLCFRRLGEMVEVSWDNEQWAAPRSDLRFVEQRGTEFISARNFSEVVRTTLSEVSSVLRARNPHRSETIADLELGDVEPGDWKWLIHSSTSTLIRRELPELAERLDGHVIKARENAYIPHCTETLLLRRAGLDSAGEVQTLLHAAQNIPSRVLSETLLKLVHRSVPSTSQPWKEGYERALEMREALGWGIEPMPDPKTWLTEQHVAVRECALPGDIALLSLVTPDDRATIAVSTRSRPYVRRETAYGTALAHVLFDIDRVAVDGTWEYWPSAARARAFAVMLQLPNEGVRKVLSGQEVKEASDVRRVMQHFKSGPHATVHHLRNLGFIPSDERRDEVLRDVLAMAS